MLRVALVYLPVLFVVAGCRGSEPSSERAKRSDALLSKSGRVVLDRAGEAACGRSPVNDPLIMEGAPPPPAGYKAQDLPEEEGGAVYNAEVARALARTYINAIYDSDVRPGIDPPLRARLERGVWYLSGPPLPEGSVGGEFYLQICQNNGRLLNYLATQ